MVLLVSYGRLNIRYLVGIWKWVAYNKSMLIVTLYCDTYYVMYSLLLCTGQGFNNLMLFRITQASWKILKNFSWFRQVHASLKFFDLFEKTLIIFTFIWMKSSWLKLFCIFWLCWVIALRLCSFYTFVAQLSIKCSTLWKRQN